jgi:hypothetical protein
MLIPLNLVLRVEEVLKEYFSVKCSDPACPQFRHVGISGLLIPPEKLCNGHLKIKQILEDLESWKAACDPKEYD